MILNEGFSAGTDLNPQGTFGNIWEYFGLPKLGKGIGAMGI